MADVDAGALHVPEPQAEAQTNGRVIEAEVEWFTRVLDARFRIHGGEIEAADADPLVMAPPPLLRPGTPYADEAGDLAPDERLVLILALLPQLRPQALDPLLIQNSQSGRPFTEFGGAPQGALPGFRPTRETALFLIAGEAMDRRLAAMRLFEPDATLLARRILDHPEEPGEEGPWMPLVPGRDALARLTTGAAATPSFGPAFPAQPIGTAYQWSDLVLPEDVIDELDDLATWVERESDLLGRWGLVRHVKPGYRALFHGPPGTGKTVTAAVLGKRLGRPVYRVDLSRVVSKWIGETEKNLGLLFDRAEGGGMILFFDEADALFGRRGEAKSANDRHANQQIGYLLQRIEDCPGLVILASNLRQNIDEAFARRFQAIVAFPAPDAAARLLLWRNALAGVPHDVVQAAQLDTLARDYPLSGGAIVNAVRRFCIQMLREPAAAPAAALRMAAERELAKEGRQRA